MKNFKFILSAWLLAPAFAFAQQAVERLEVETGPGVLRAPAKTQQLNVAAQFKDGTRKFVTLIAKYTTSDEETATVNAAGLVEFKKPGEVTIICRHEMHLQAVRLTLVPEVANFRWPDPPQSNFVDKHVYAKLKLVRMTPSDLCSDTDFVRRVYLDLCGIPPTPDEVRQFLADKANDKREKLIDQLLERPEYADYWTYLWLDVLGTPDRALARKSVYAYRDWVRAQIVKNTPLDRFAFELLTAQGHSEKDGQANFYRTARTPTEAAENAAQVFLGVRLQCVKCHQHPTAKWTPEDYTNLAAFFAGVVRTRVDKKVDGEAISLDAKGEFLHPMSKKPVAPKFPGGIDPKLLPDQDRREGLARWITSADNPYFARTMANRVWQRLFAKGIVELPDDATVPGLAANDELLDGLANELVRQKFDVRHLIRTIMASRTYQLSAASNHFNKTDTRYFARCYSIPLRKEQLADSIAAATEMPYEFKGLPPGTRLIQAFEPEAQPIFSLPIPRRNTDCEREARNERNLALTLHWLNSEEVKARTNSPKNRVGRLLNTKLNEMEIFDELFLATLSRLPREQERKTLTEHLDRHKERRRDAWDDVLWALVNAREFMVRH